MVALVSNLSHPETSDGEARRMFDLLGNPVVELRALRRHDDVYGDTFVAFFTNSCEFAETAAGLSSARAGSDVYQGVFVTINRLDDVFQEVARTFVVGSGWGTKDHQVARLTTLFIDVDPKRDHPLGGKVCSTDPEHEAALQVVEEVRQFLTSQGWPEALVMDSGSGGYLLYRIDLPNNKESKALLEAVLHALASKYNSDTIHIDESVTNPARIARVAGTINRKSAHCEERPNRTVRILSAPADDCLQPVSLDQLNTLAGTNRQPSLECQTTADKIEFHEFDAQLHNELVHLVVQYLDQSKLPHGDPDDSDERFTKVELSYCPFKGSDHTDGRSAILIWKDGTIGFKCFHDKCKGKSWRGLQEELELSFDDVAEDVATRHVTKQSTRIFNDPLLLGQRHLTKTKIESHWTLTHFLGDTYRYDGRDGWLETNPTTLAPWVRETVQEAFDAHAAAVSRIVGRRVKPKPIRGQVVPDTIKAMESICKRDLSIKTQSPFWLEPHQDWDADDLLLFRNGILNIRKWLENTPDHFIQSTPQLFCDHRAEFDYDPKAEPPAEWNNFLATLGQPQDWIDSLQQIMGYCLWRKYDLQKYFMLVGPPRCGKGTIVRVIRDLVGGPSAVCAPSLKDFAKDFGLEQAIGKRLALVPEVNPPRDSAEIVANIKAITGGDMVTVSRKNIANIPMLLKIKILMQSNHFVALPDNSGALHARLMLLNFKISFKGKEDQELAEKLEKEYPAILNWALEGLRKLRSNSGKFTIPEETQTQLDQLLAESAPLQQFIDDCCFLDSGHGCQSPAFYEIYKDWMKRERPSVDVLTDAEFAQELRNAVNSVFKKRARKPNERDYDGFLIVQTDFDVEPDKRPYLWLGICPKVEFRKKVCF